MLDGRLASMKQTNEDDVVQMLIDEPFSQVFWKLTACFLNVISTLPNLTPSTTTIIGAYICDLAFQLAQYTDFLSCTVGSLLLYFIRQTHFLQYHHIHAHIRLLDFQFYDPSLAHS